MARRRCEARSPPPERAGNGHARQPPLRNARRSRLQAVERVAVVTGASSGIGAAIARALATRGWRCILVARREERLRSLAEEIGNAEVEPCDVSDRAAVDRLAAAVQARHSALHLLVNNAGIPGRHGFTSIPPERLEEVFRTNYLGGVWCLRAFLPALRAARRADVVNVVSVAGTVAFAPSGPYSASKHAQLAFSRSVTAELRPQGIHVHTVNPGFVETEGFPQRQVLRSPFFRRAVIEPADVASAVLDALDRNRREIFVPRWYRLAAVAQALTPGLLARVSSRSAYRPTIES